MRKRYRVSWNKVIGEFRLNITDIQVLYELKNTPATVKVMAEHIGCSTRSIMRAIRRLEEKELVIYSHSLAHNEKVYKLDSEAFKGGMD